MTARELRGQNLVITLVVGLVAVAGVGVLAGRPLWKGRCSAGFGEISSKELGKLHSVPLDQVNLDDFHPEYRPNAQNLLEAARHPAAPLGEARDAVVVPHVSGSGSARLANSNDGDVRFVVGGGGLIGSHSSGGIVQVDDETGRAAWGRRQVGYAPGGGDASDRFMMMNIPNDKAPRVAAVDTSNGDLAWCTKLGEDTETDWRPTFDSTAKGDALFTVRASDSDGRSDGDVRLSRLDTQSGEVSWDEPVKGVTKAASLDLLGDRLLLSPLRTDMDDQARWNVLDSDHNPQPVADRGAVIARSAADGSAGWSYRGPDDRGWINNVVGVGKDTAVVISRRSTEKGSGPWVTETWMVGIDRAGKQLWKHDFKNQFTYDLSSSFVVTGDLVLSHENGVKKDTSLLVARDLATGAERWRTREGTGSPLRPNASDVVGDTLLTAPFTGGLIAVDLKTGALSNPLPGKKYGLVDGLVSDGRTVTIDLNGLFITFNKAF